MYYDALVFLMKIATDIEISAQTRINMENSRKEIAKGLFVTLDYLKKKYAIQ